jgi:hypothetical protein
MKVRVGNDMTDITGETSAGPPNWVAAAQDDEDPAEVILPAVDQPVTLRQITVTRAYQGDFTGGQVVLPGVYIENDPALLGMAQFLVDNAYASVTG